MTRRRFVNKKEIEEPIQAFPEPGREDPSALVGEAYQELRHIARAFRRRFPHQTLQTTDLVHEAFVRLAKSGPKKYVNQPYFFACSGRAMYAALIDRARRRQTWKRGRGFALVSLNQVTAAKSSDA
jgi:DNA-directed RNA polymerase specialized sigma24 family protein